jgi:hypothetical protein
LDLAAGRTTISSSYPFATNIPTHPSASFSTLSPPFLAPEFTHHHTKKPFPTTSHQKLTTAMAPKGGGKGGGSGSKSGSSGSSGKKGRPTNWSKQVRLLGSHFKKPALVASIAVSCLCLLGLLVVAVRAYTVKPNGRKVFLWFGLPLAVTAAVM